MATTLSQFYSDKGQALPSVSQRGSLAAQAGIQGYSGTAAQNNQLLNFMQTSGTGQTGTQNLQSIQPPVIPAATALGNTKPTDLPTTPQGTKATELSAATSGYFAQPVLDAQRNIGTQLNESNKVAQTNADTAANDYTKQFLETLTQRQNLPGVLEKQYGLQQLTADLIKSKANYDSVELAYRRKKENLMNDASLTSDQKSAVISDIERKEASQKADIAIDYNLKAGLVSNAKELIQKQQEMELETGKMKLDFYKDNRDRFDKILDKTEMRQYDYIQKKEERAYQAAKESADRIASLQMKAVENGASWDEAKNIKSIGDYAKLNISASTLLDPKILSTPDYKTISALSPAITAINDYKKAVEKYGSYEKLNAEGSGILKSAYGDAIAAWKTLAGLGALSGADFGLAENTIPSPSLLTRNKKVNAQLVGAIDRATKQSSQVVSNLKLAYPDSKDGLDALLQQSTNTSYLEKNDPLGLNLQNTSSSNNPLGI